jgi:hypothetical protein
MNASIIAEVALLNFGIVEIKELENRLNKNSKVKKRFS